MQYISSNLASQTINKRTIWGCLVSLELVEAGELSKFDSDRMIVEGWAVGIRVVLKKAYRNTIEVCKGLSTIISPLKAAQHILEKTIGKARGLNAVRKSLRMFVVDSAQNPEEKHTVIAAAEGLVCSCMKFKCLSNRLHKEAPQLLEAMGKVELLDGSKVCRTEFYNTKTRKIEEKIHIQCHHIRVVMTKFFNAFTSQEYLLNWREVMNSYEGNKDEIFPRQWGEFKPKTKPLDEVPF